MAVKGVKELLNKFQAFGKEAENEFSLELESGAKNIARIARNNVPKNNGQLAQSIHDDKINKLNFEIVVSAPYAGYVEFGTGVKVVVPEEMKDVANAIKNNPKGDIKEALESIKDWCRNKGIDQRASWPILMSILDEGLRPRPFLWPAFVQGSAIMVKNMKKTLDSLAKDFNK